MARGHAGWPGWPGEILCGMHTAHIQEALVDALTGRRLLTHPFYRRWEAGTLADGELAAYAEQYRHLEGELPLTLAAIAGQLPAGRARTLVEANLADELGEPAPHAVMFESFARAAGRGRTWHRPRRPRRCSRPFARRSAAIRWLPCPWWRPTKSRPPTSPPQRPTACAATTAWMPRARGSGTSTPRRKWPTPAGRPKRWPMSMRTPPLCTSRRGWPPRPGGLFSPSARSSLPSLL